MDVTELLEKNLEEKLKIRRISNRNYLVMAMREEWSKISPVYWKKAVESMPNRLKDVIKQKGLATKY